MTPGKGEVHIHTEGLHVDIVVEVKEAATASILAYELRALADSIDGGAPSFLDFAASAPVIEDEEDTKPENNQARKSHASHIRKLTKR